MLFCNRFQGICRFKNVSICVPENAARVAGCDRQPHPDVRVQQLSSTTEQFSQRNDALTASFLGLCLLLLQGKETFVVRCSPLKHVKRSNARAKLSCLYVFGVSCRHQFLAAGSSNHWTPILNPKQTKLVFVNQALFPVSRFKNTFQNHHWGNAKSEGFVILVNFGNCIQVSSV